jgi:ABC-type bacteriocin/lantibiotic exporter with double-glycine peptidase domain
MVKLLFLHNNDDLSDKNFTKLNNPMFRACNNCFYFIMHVIDKLLPNVTLLFIVFAYFFYNNIIFGLIFLTGNLIASLYIYYIWNNLLSMNEKLEDSIIDSESLISEILNNFDKIIYRAESKNELNSLSESSEKVINHGYHFYKKSSRIILYLNIIIFITIFILLYYLIYLFRNKEITSTIFITFLTILLLYRDIILSSIEEIPEYIEFLNRIKLTDKLFEKDEIINDNRIINSHYPQLRYNYLIFKNIRYKYKKTDKYILNDFNLQLDINNKIIGITGVSGKGKSTLAKILIKLYKYEGDVYIDNLNIKDIDTTYLRKNIIYVNQNSKLFDKKIIENIFYGCTDESCYEKLEFIMQFKKINELYKNIDFNKKAGLSGEKLSGGQRQVINIINGLIVDSKITILDEPTNALDIELKKEIIEIIKYFKRYKKCIIIISHDSDIYNIFDQTIEIK